MFVFVLINCIDKLSMYFKFALFFPLCAFQTHDEMRKMQFFRPSSKFCETSLVTHLTCKTARQTENYRRGESSYFFYMGGKRGFHTRREGIHGSARKNVRIFSTAHWDYKRYFSNWVGKGYFYLHDTCSKLRRDRTSVLYTFRRVNCEKEEK